jgi:hypothetical protein
MAFTAGALRGPTFSAGVVALARRRQRRRALATALIVAVAGAGGGLVTTLRDGPPAGAIANDVAPAAVLAQPPDVGMACLQARACDRVGVAVWLRRPAESVSATVEGHPVALDLRAAAQFEPDAQRTRRMFVGYFQWPRLAGTRIFFAAGPPSRWWAANPASWPAPLVVIRIAGPNAAVALTATRVSLQGGWG